MNLARALIYPFDDPEWFSKLLATVALGFMALLLMPVLFIGLLPVCILFGYMLGIVDNMRGDKPRQHPLPLWADLAEMLSRGGNVLLAVLVYNMPLLLLGICMLTLPRAFGPSVTSGVVILSMLCCLLPLMVGYTFVVWPMLAVGVARYTHDGNANVFFRAGLLFEDVQNLGTYSVQWTMAVLIVNLCQFILLFIPFLGWGVLLALTIPIHGHLLGQYTRHFDRYIHKRRQGPGA